MATVAARAKMTALALNRLIAVAQQMSDEVGIAPPQSLDMRYRDNAEAKQKLIQNLADWLEAYHEAVNTSATDYSDMTVDDLTDEAQARGIYDTIEGTGANGGILKQDLINALTGG